MKKSYRGIVEYSFSIYLLILAAVLILCIFRMELLSAVRRRTEDALVSANLAAALIDLEAYDEEERAVITEERKAYGRYLKTLKENLCLNQEMFPVNDRLIRGKVIVEVFQIFNVSGNDVEQLDFTEDGMVNRLRISGGKGIVQTPNGKTVEYTSIYSRIGFYIRGLFGQTVYVTKDNCVDIEAQFLEEEDEEEGL